MMAFYVAGGALVLWAVVVSFLGITREGFPNSDGSMRLVMTISVVLTLSAILSGIIGSALHEEPENEGHKTEPAALLLNL